MEIYIRYLDFLSPTVTFYYKGFLSHSSFVSAILSIISFLVIISIAGYFSLELIKRETPTTFYYNSFVDDAGIFPLNSSSFFHFISLSLADNNYSDNGVDFRHFRVIGLENFFADYLLDRDITHYNHWLYGYCNTESDIQGIEHLIDYDFFPKSACIRKYFDKNDQQYYDTKDSKFRWPVMAHGTSNPNKKYYAIVLEKCQEDRINLILGEDSHCKANEELGNSIGTSSSAHFFYVDHYIDVLNYKNPNVKYIYRVENSMQLNFYPINHLNFNPIFVETHNGLVFDSINNTTAYSYERNDVFTEENKGNDVYTVYYLWLSNRQNYYKRKYKRIQDAISEIGGIYQFISIIAIFINRLYNNYIVLLDTENLLFSSIDSNNNKIKKVQDLPKEKINKNIKNNSKNISIKEKENKNKSQSRNEIVDKKQNESNNNKNIDVCFNNYEEAKNDYNHKLDKIFNKKTTFNSDDIIISTKKETINFFTYFVYKLLCGKKYTYYRGFEEFRKRIISEEHLMKSHLNIYNLLKYSKKKRNYRRNSYRLKDLIKLV